MRRCVGLHWLSHRWGARHCPAAPSSRPGHFSVPSQEQRRGVSLKIPLVEFAAPRSHTHEDLAYASCPICGRVTHMCDMLTHLTTAHRELSASHCKRICGERLVLYQRAIGVPLKKIDVTSSGRRVLDFLPTILPTGYMCNWCETKRDIHSTRDKFLKHVADAHAEIDLDEIETHVPQLPRVTEERSSEEPVRPTRRLAGVEAVPEVVTSVPAAPRQIGICVPRSIDRPMRAAPTAAGDADFPCELCGRAFLNEMDLLQHLETRHPDGKPESAPDSETSTAIAEVAQFTAREATLGGDKRIHVVCDLCQSSRVYTIPSALFSHIRFKHSSEDAAFHVDRLIRSQEKSPSFICKQCNKAFASASALDGHMQNKHVEQTAATGTAGRVLSNNFWWCHDCEKGFASAKGLHGHMQSKHGLLTQAHPCPACKRVFPDVYSLEEHITQQHKTISLGDLGLVAHATCSGCERCFLTYEDLHRHAVKHHKKDPRAPVRPFESSTASPKTAAPKVAARPGESVGNVAETVKEESKGPRKVKRKKKSAAASGSSE